MIEIDLGHRLLRADHGRYGIIDGLYLGIGLLSPQLFHMNTPDPGQNVFGIDRV